MSVVVDASVAFKWFVADEEYAAEAAELLEHEKALIAPDILIAEVCNTAWRSVRQGRLGPEHADRIAEILPNYFTTLARAAALAPRAVVIARELDHPVYDCLYLALAEARQTTLVTADRRFLSKLGGTLWQATTRSLTEYVPRG